jgi:hypothetical protein
VFGLFTSLAPSFIAGTLHEPSRLVAGAVTFAVFGMSALAQIIFARLDALRQLQLARWLLAVGLVAMAVGVLITSLPVFVIAGMIAGAGVGVLFRSAVATAASLALPPSRGEILAALFLVAYTGIAVPVLLIGLAVAFLSTTVVLVGFSALVLALSLWAGSRMIAHRRELA